MTNQLQKRAFFSVITLIVPLSIVLISHIFAFKAHDLGGFAKEAMGFVLPAFMLFALGSFIRRGHSMKSVRGVIGVILSLPAAICIGLIGAGLIGV